MLSVYVGVSVYLGVYEVYFYVMLSQFSYKLIASLMPFRDPSDDMSLYFLEQIINQDKEPPLL